MAAPILLSCQSISKSFGVRPLFDGLTFAVHEGDHVGLVGPNGAGKSTLLKILANAEVPDSGLCTRRRNLRVGYVPQHPTFEPGLTVGAILAESIAGVSRLDPHEKEHRVAVALGKVGFVDPGLAADTLSGGWRTRLAIARAVVADPELLLLDEPSSGLDPRGRRELNVLLSGLAATQVIASHDLDFVSRLCTRAVLMDRGVIVAQGPTGELLSDTALLRRHGLD